MTDGYLSVSYSRQDLASTDLWPLPTTAMSSWPAVLPLIAKQHWEEGLLGMDICLGRYSRAVLGLGFEGLSAELLVLVGCIGLFILLADLGKFVAIGVD